MTQWKKTTVGCPACLEEGEFRICTFQDVVLEPELKEDIFNRSIFRYTCPECGEEILVSYNCTYFDSDKNFAVTLVADSDDTTLSSTCNTLRVVRSINAFIEKIALMEDGIDDRIVELYKIMLEDQFEEERQGSEILGIYYSGQNQTDKSLNFYIITGNAENCRASLSFDVYTSIAKQFEATRDFDDDCTEIDRNWAIGALQSGFTDKD